MVSYMYLSIDILFSVNLQTSVLFIIGSTNYYSNETRHKLKEEIKTYGDLIVADELVEHYDNLTLKTLYTLKFFIEKGTKLMKLLWHCMSI